MRRQKGYCGMVKAFRQTGPERGMCVVDARRRIVQANTPLARLLGKDRPSEVVGQALDRFLNTDIDKVLDRARRRRARNKCRIGGVSGLGRDDSV